MTDIKTFEELVEKIKEFSILKITTYDGIPCTLKVCTIKHKWYGNVELEITKFCANGSGIHRDGLIEIRIDGKLFVNSKDPQKIYNIIKAIKEAQDD